MIQELGMYLLLNLEFWIFLIICMKPNKPDAIVDIRSGDNQLSDIDIFSKLECSFLEKFFNYNISDYFHDSLINVYEDSLERKTSSKI